MPERAGVRQSILLIRASSNETDAAALEALGLDSVTEPYLSIAAVSDPADGQYLLSQLATANSPIWLIATSVNAIEKWAQIVGPEILTRTIARRTDLRFAAIGERTVAALMKFGAKRVVAPETGDSAGLAELLTELAPATAIIPSGSLAMKTLPDALRGSGWAVLSGVVYETKTVAERPATADRIDAGEFAAVVLRSPSAARALAEHSRAVELKTPVISAGQTTSATAESIGLNLVATSELPTPVSLAETVKKWVDQKGSQQ